MPRSLVLATLLAAFAPEGCELPYVDDFRYAEQEHHLLPGSDGGALRYVEVYRALSSTGGDSLPALEALLEGRRVYPPEGGFLHIDLDEPFEEDDFDLGDPREARLAELLERLPACVQVEGAGLFLDARGELCAWRATRIAPLGDLLAAVDGLVSVGAFWDLGRSPEEGGLSFPWLEPTSLELARERAEAGGPWIRVLEGRLVLDVPLSPDGAARALEQLATRAEDPPLAPWFLSQVWSVSATEESVLVALGSTEGPAVHFLPPSVDRRDGPDAELIEALRARGLPLGGPQTLDGVLARLRGH